MGAIKTQVCSTGFGFWASCAPLQLKRCGTSRRSGLDGPGEAERVCSQAELFVSIQIPQIKEPCRHTHDLHGAHEPRRVVLSASQTAAADLVISTTAGSR